MTFRRPPDSRPPRRAVAECALRALLRALAATLVTGPAAAAPPAQAKVHLCVACHGEDGIGRDPSWPNLAGQKPDYLARQIAAFRDGTRRNDMMVPLVAELSDADIEALAAWYAAQPCAAR